MHEQNSFVGDQIEIMVTNSVYQSIRDGLSNQVFYQVRDFMWVDDIDNTSVENQLYNAYTNQ